MVTTTSTVEVTTKEGTENAEIEGYVNVTLSMLGVTTTVKVPAGTLIVEEGEEVEELELEGYTFDGYFADADGETEFDFTKAIDEDTTIYALFTEIVEEAPEDETKNPQTGDNLYFMISMAALSFAGLFLVAKKVSARNHA